MFSDKDQNFISEQFRHISSTYFNTAYFGPSPQMARSYIDEKLDKELDPSFYQYKVWAGYAEEIRIKIATLLDCPTNNIAHSTSTSDIINMVANGFPLKESETVCSIDKEYPSNVLPWMLAKKNRNIHFDLVEIDPEVGAPTAAWLEKNIPKTTKILNLSHVTFDTGKRIDLLEIGKFCQSRDIFFIVDATQSLGGIEIKKEELANIDLLACSSYKWILGPYGHAFAYFSDKALELIQYQNANWLKSPKSKEVYSLLEYTTDTHPGARRFDRGQTSNMLTLACLEASLDFLNKVGLNAIEVHNSGVRDHFLENFPKKDFKLLTPKESMGNIICLKSLNIDPFALEKEFTQANIDLSIRQGNLRLSFHAFNTKEQVEFLIKVMSSL